MKRHLALFVLTTFFIICRPCFALVDHYTYSIVKTYPHDRTAFTQGLFYHDGHLYESTGLRGQSNLRKVAVGSGEIKKIRSLPSAFFGEGTTLFRDKIYQLTWQSRTGFIYDMDFNLSGRFQYNTEGWGLTNDGRHFIMTDGSHNLYFRDTKNFAIRKKLEVTYKGQPVRHLNELEYIDGMVYANVWKKDYVVIIDPDSGVVTGVVDLSDMINPEDYNHRLDVLNGIAYDADNDRLFVTGKLWPLIFEIKIHRRED